MSVRRSLPSFRLAKHRHQLLRYFVEADTVCISAVRTVRHGIFQNNHLESDEENENRFQQSHVYKRLPLKGNPGDEYKQRESVFDVAFYKHGFQTHCVVVEIRQHTDNAH